MTERQEYTRLRKNILERYGRIEKLKLKAYVVTPKLEKASALTDRQLKSALKRARRYDKSITVKAAKQRRAKRLTERKARGFEEKLYRTGQKKDAYFIRGVRKWLRRQGKPITLINEKNYKDWQEYVNYRKAIAGEKGKYEFDRYVEEMADILTDEQKKTDVETVLADYKQYMAEQQKFIEEAKQLFGDGGVPEEYHNYYSSRAITERFFTRK